ncbi:MAG: hypothetical protein M3Z03_11350 [Actinomycetota bacterium]|nr:hypothetical protein [Actinomycetota bacterium]
MTSVPLRRRSGTAALLAAALLASSPHAVAQDDRPRAVDATVAGIVVGADGQPLDSVPITVTETDTGIGTGPVIGLFTLGVGCLAGLCSDDTRGTVDRTTTAADGSYRATLPDAYVAGTETDADWVVRASLPASGNQRSGPTSAFEFETNIQLQAAPPLPIWSRDPQVSVDGWGVSIDVGSTPPGLSEPSVNMETPRLRLRQTGTAATFDARLLEFDAIGEKGLAVNGTASADVRVSHANGRTIYHQRTTTAIVPVDLSLIPASRGAPCTARSAAGADLLPAAPEAGCPLTDGNMLSNVSGAITPTAPAQGDVTTTTARPVIAEATIDLLGPVEASLVVLRGVDPGPVVDLSLDGAAWTTVRTVAAPTIADGSRVSVAAPPAGTSARYVRVRHPAGVDPGEVSVWTPRPLASPAPAAGGDLEPVAPGEVTTPPVDAVADDGAADDGDDGDNDSGNGSKALAVLLVIGVWVALSRRRRPAGNSRLDPPSTTAPPHRTAPLRARPK